jgi:hypothetical protein
MQLIAARLIRALDCFCSSEVFMAKSDYLDDEQLKGLIEMFGPKEIDDPFFGPLRFTWDHRHPMTWKGSILFKPTNEQIEIYVGGPGQDNPTEKEQAFYRELEAKYPKLAEMIADDLLAYMKNVRAGFWRKDVWREFKIRALQIPNCNMMHPWHWNLTYSCESNSQHFSILMLDWDKRGLWVDGWAQSNHSFNRSAR